MKTYIKNILIALDQLLGTFFGGSPDTTISAQCWIWHMRGKRDWPYKLVDAIFWYEEQHCYYSYLSEVTSSQQSKYVK